MPLSSILADEPIYAFNYSPEAWQELRTQASELRFPCCDAGVILKRSHIGTQFFAHARKGVCVTGPETMDHLQAKDAIARAAIAAGWKAESEVRGKSPAGEAWTADVMVTRGNVKLAFEVQLARQSEEVTRARQERYAASGVRALWLMRQPARVDLPQPSKSLPLFRLESTPDGFQVAIDWTFSFSRPALWVPLDEFVAGALSKRLVWRPLEGQIVSITRHVGRQTCFTCGTRSAIPGLAHITKNLSFDQLGAINRFPGLMEILYPEDDRQRYQIAGMKTGGPYCWVSCSKCGGNLKDPPRSAPSWRTSPRTVNRSLPLIKITLTGDVLDALNNPYVIDVWGFTETDRLTKMRARY